MGMRKDAAGRPTHCSSAHPAPAANMQTRRRVRCMVLLLIYSISCTAVMLMHPVARFASDFLLCMLYLVYSLSSPFSRTLCRSSLALSLARANAV
eukprot:459040-Pleurochrysis_carterae.AAC.8